MPVIAVVAAVAIDGAALAGGIAAMTTLTAITAIGATLGAIGAVTHNKTLGLIGAGLGLVGGIGSLAFGSGALGNVSDLFGSSSADAANSAAIGETWGAGQSAVPEAGSNLGGTAYSAAGTDITTATGGLDTAALTPNGAINATSISPAEGNAAAIETGGDTSGALGQSLSQPTTQAGSASWTGTPQANAFAPGSGGTSLTPGASAGMGDTAFSSDVGGVHSMNMPGIGSSSPVLPGGIMNWAKNNQLLSYGIIQAGGSFISGLTDPMTPAQIKALNAQAAANNAAAGLAERETANMGQAMPTATVTGTPQNTGGLINRKPVGTPIITGAPTAAGASVTGATA